MAAIALLASLLAAGGLVVYLTGGTRNVFPHLMYVPIVAAAFLFQLPGALATAVLAGLVVGPLMPLNVEQGIPQDLEGWVIRTLFFLLIGTVLGQLQTMVEERLEAMERLLEKVSLVYSRVLSTFAAIAEHRDKPTGDHHIRMAHNARNLAIDLGLDPLQQEHVYWAALLHDLGKVAVPDQILTKPGPLDPGEMVEIRRHVEVGAELLLGVSADLMPVVEGVRAHHERWDGSGYPRGLAGEEIPLSGRILAVVDVFDALTCLRPYRQPIPAEEALAYLQEHAGAQFDPRIVEAFEELYRKGIVLTEGGPRIPHPETTPTRFHEQAISY